MRNAPRFTLEKLMKERYQNALAIFWAGSVSNEQGTDGSDLDLVIVYEKLPNAYREAFICDGWPIDAFVNDMDTIRYFFEESRAGSGISGLIHMVLHGQEITPASHFSASIKKLARQFLESGPVAWSKETIDKERFLITDTLEDIQFPKSRAELLASTAWLFEALSQFYFRAQGKWCASGKSIIRYLEQNNPEIAEEFSKSFEDVFQASDVVKLEKLTQKILKPYGGLLWDGYKSEAPADSKRSEAIMVADTQDGCFYYIEETTNNEVASILFEGIKSYNESKIGEYTRNPFTIYAKSRDNNKIMGGCDGHITGIYCYVHRFWVDIEYRKKGIGRALLHELENYAKKKNCQSVSLDTAAFQAKEFYEKLGYSVVSIVDGIIFPGYEQYFMRKML